MSFSLKSIVQPPMLPGQDSGIENKRRRKSDKLLGYSTFATMQTIVVECSAGGDLRRFSLKLICFLLLASFFAISSAFPQTPGSAPRMDAWKIIGPGGGGTMASPTISPNDPKVIVLRCDMTGAYITHNGGLSWRMFNLRG